MGLSIFKKNGVIINSHGVKISLTDNPVVSMVPSIDIEEGDTVSYSIESDLEIPSHLSFKSSTYPEKNIFNKMDRDTLKRYFGQLTERHSTRGGAFLTDEQVDLFIDRAFFGHKEIGKIRLNAAHGDYFSIWKLFYNYYDSCAQKYGSGVVKKAAYIQLITENFLNYGNPETLKKNFRRDRAKTPWRSLDLNNSAR